MCVSVRLSVCMDVMSVLPVRLMVCLLLFSMSFCLSVVKCISLFVWCV